MTPDVLIIGGGLMGASTALQLAKRDQKVLVLEKDAPGRHASGVNAGGLRQLNRHPAEIPLTVEAAKLWRNIRELVDSDCDARFTGQLRVAENHQDLQLLQQRADLVRSLGYTHETIIDRDELFRLVPVLSRHCVGALYCREDGYARPYHTLTAFRRKAQSLGVTFLAGNKVGGVERTNDLWQVQTPLGHYQAPILVNCAGAWANQIAKALGEEVPLTPKAPMLMITERLPPFIEPVLGAASRKLSFKQMQNGTLLIGGAHLARLDFGQERTEIDWGKLKESAATVTALFPQLKKVRIVRTWAGLEAFMPDNIPVIGPSSTLEHAYHAFGFSAHGFQLSPIVGIIMSQLILDGKSQLPIDAFRVDRFQKKG